VLRNQSHLWNLFFPWFLTECRRQGNDREFVELLNEVRTGQISERTWATLSKLHESFTVSESLWTSTFVVSRRETCRAINKFVTESLSYEPITYYAVDRDEDHMPDSTLDGGISAKTFKNYTNLPEELTLCVGARVMFLDNSMIRQGISNGSTGVIIDLKLDPLQPTVCFPTSEGIRVHHYVLVSADALGRSSVFSYQVFRHQWSHL
jgi:hypothetical protein